MLNRVFISYRRADTSGHAGRISDDLERHFGQAVAFRDIESIAAGSDYVRALHQAIGDARVCIVLMGRTWLTEPAGDGTRRLDDPFDTVRREVELALGNADLLVLPVLVEGAVMPTAEQLPPSLQKLARLQALELSEARWDHDVSRLAALLRDAGAAPDGRGPTPAWLAPALMAFVAVLIAVAAYGWRTQVRSVDDYTGLWHLPNGGFWTVLEKDAGLWVEETHYDSRQVWKRGPGTLGADGLNVSLELVFERAPFRYLYALRLANDRLSMIGSVRRSDRQVGESLVLTRIPQ